MHPAGNRPAVKCKLRNWWESDGVKSISRELYGSSEGSHATPSEVSLTWYAYPDAARPMTMDPPVAPTGTFADADDYRRNFPDGRIGSNPALSSVEAGKRLYDASVKDLTADYKAWLNAA